MGWATLSAAADRVAQRHLGGLEFTCNGVTGTGFLLKRSRFIMDGEVMTIRCFLTALTADAESFSHGDLLTMDGKVFRVEVQGQPFEDGTWCEVPLSDPTTLAPEPVITLYLTTTTGQQLTSPAGVPLVAI
ncbi:MAG: hypothetical protein ACK587_07260 [Cyanobacteriota bacterium]